MHRDDDVVGAGDVLEDAGDEAGELVRDRVSDGVGNVDRGRAGLDHLAQHAADEIDIRARRVHRRELDVAGVLLRPGDHLARLLQHRLAVLAQLVRDVDVGGGEEDVDARILRVADRFPALVDIVGHGAAERRDLGAAHFAGDAVDGVEVGRRGGGEAGLDAVDAHALEQLGDLQLLLSGEGDAGGLFAVAQGGIKDSDSVSHSGNSSGQSRDQTGALTWPLSPTEIMWEAAAHQATSTPRATARGSAPPSTHRFMLRTIGDARRGSESRLRQSRSGSARGSVGGSPKRIDRPFELLVLLKSGPSTLCCRFLYPPSIRRLRIGAWSGSLGESDGEV